MARKGSRKVMQWSGFEFELIGIDVCYILAFRSEPEIDQKSITLGDGSTLRPGDKLTHIGGKKTSAGFSTIWFDDDKAMEYVGIHSGLDGRFACFRQGGKFGSHNNFKCLVFAWKVFDDFPSEWFFTNQAGAGRIMETTVIKRLEDEVSEMLTTKQAGDALGVSASRIRQLILERRLPAKRYGRDLFIKRSDLDLIKDRPPGRPKKEGDSDGLD